MKYPEEIYHDRCKELEKEIAILRRENDTRQGRIDRLEQLHKNVIAYQMGASND